MMMRNVILILLSLCLCTRIADASLSLAQRIKGFDMTDAKNEKSAPVVQNDPNVDTMQVVISVPEVKVVNRKKSTTKSATAPAVPTTPSTTSAPAGKGDSTKKIHTKKSVTKSKEHKQDKVTLPPTPPPTPMPTPAPTIFVDPNAGCSKSGKGGKGGKGSKQSSRRDLQFQFTGTASKGKGGSKGSKKCSKRGNMGGPMVPGINPNVPLVPVGVPVFPVVVPVGVPGTLPIPIPPIPPPSGARLSKKGTIASQRGPDLVVAPAPVAIPGAVPGVPGLPATPTQKDSKRRRLY